jgi:hypothetical protein
VVGVVVNPGVITPPVGGRSLETESMIISDEHGGFPPLTEMLDHDFCRMIALRDASRLIFKVNLFSGLNKTFPLFPKGTSCFSKTSL